MKNAGITVILVGVAVAGFAGYEGLKWLEKQNAPTAADVTKQVDAVRAEAAQKHPGMSQTDAMKKVAAAKAADTMRETSPDQRSRVAAEAVFGAYFMNTRVRQAHCKQLGVEISGFASAYERIHAEELAKAKAIYAEQGRSPEAFATLLGPAMQRMIEQDMRDIAQARGMSPEKTCSAFNDNADAYARAIQLPPAIRQALMAS